MKAQLTMPGIVYEGVPARALVVTLPIRTSNPSNLPRGNSRLAAIVRSRKDARQRQMAYVLTLSAIRNAGLSRVHLVPARVTITRISTGRLDPHDGLPPALKRVVDGVADALGVNDGGPFVQWHYDQRRGARGQHLVEIRIERLGS